MDLESGKRGETMSKELALALDSLLTAKCQEQQLSFSTTSCCKTFALSHLSNNEKVINTFKYL